MISRRHAPRLGAVTLALAAATTAPAQKALEPEHRARLDALQPKIDTAIDKGVEWLLREQHRDGSWSFQQETFPGGQTALCAYTLMHCGLSPEHGAIRRALRHLATIEHRMVYSASCEALALAATRDPAAHPRIERIVRDVASWQDGTWSYPNTGEHAHLHSDRDLSITQFAMLALRAAHKAGLRIDKRDIRTAFEKTLRYQENGKTAGFRYRWAEHTKPTGSMTTAGIATLLMARECLEPRVPRKLRKECDEACARGIEWLAANWAVDENPGKGESWLYYYLYGLERVGALLGTEYVGAHPWYVEGAEFLVGEQASDGSWTQHNQECDTCFALLFLERATAAPTTGQSKQRNHVVTSEAVPGPGIRLTARPLPDGSSLQLWLSSVELPDGDDLRVDEVVYEINGTPVARTAIGGPWRAQTCLVEHRFDRPTEAEIIAILHATQADGDPAELESLPITVHVEHPLEPWMLDAAEAPSRNILKQTRATASAPSVHAAFDAHLAIDGFESTAWLYDKTATAEERMLSIRLDEPRRATRLRLTQARGQPKMQGTHDRIHRVRVRINREPPFEFDLEPGVARPTYVPLPSSARVRTIEIHVLTTEPGSSYPGLGGFAEVGLE